MEDKTICLKVVNDVIGMDFMIPDYQRGYRWEKQQAIDLLEDVYEFSAREAEDEQIYCLQPLVICERKDNILEKCKRPETTLDDIKRMLKGSWTVVDGQQRLTTVYLILCALGKEERFEINYETRNKSKEFLKDIENKSEEEASQNIDFFHMYLVYKAIKEWCGKRLSSEEQRGRFLQALLYQVTFIWYKVDEEEAIPVFTRLNLGKIPLTDAELIKALFLNRENLKRSGLSDNKQVELAIEWDKIEQTLQNDEFWLFIHENDYSKPTRIDFILKMIYDENAYEVYDRKKYKGEKRKRIKEENERIKERIGNDEHQVFRYFNEAFEKRRKSEEKDWLIALWGHIKERFQIMSEWYYDYKLYHYIGYLSSVGKLNIREWMKKWRKSTKDKFTNEIRNEIAEELKNKPWAEKLKDFRFDQEYEGSKCNKQECVCVLLLHNIETIIKQNEKLIKESKYNLPNCSKFPFHLFKKEKWQVEHIRPNAGDDLNDGGGKLYLALAKEYIEDEKLQQRINDYLNNQGDEKIKDIVSEICQVGGGALSEDDKNGIWNFALLDEKTNKEYGNQIFPVKRAFISDKENGKKYHYSFSNGEIKKSDPVPEIAFVPLCTKNVFMKSYTKMPTNLLNWNDKDAEEYWLDIEEKLAYYLDYIKSKKENVVS